MSELDLTPKDCAECGKKTSGGIYCSPKCWLKPKAIEITTRCPNGLDEHDCWYCEDAKARYDVDDLPTHTKLPQSGKEKK